MRVGFASWSLAAYVAGGPVSVLAQNQSGVQQQLADRGVTITTLYGAVLSGLDGGRDREAHTQET
jgi:hypothetical protein